METPNQYLTLKSGETIYGIAISKVREVVTYEKPSPMPNDSDCMIGVISLRGSAVPVLDLRKKFGLCETTPTVDTCIIILEMAVDGETVLIGITADTVQEVADFDAEDMEPAPRMASGQSTQWILGMARLADGFVVILDIDKTLAHDALLNVEHFSVLQGEDENAGESL